MKHSPALVVLTDFFAVSNRTLSYAAGLAVPLHAHLVLLHVRRDGLLAPAEYSHHTTSTERQTARQLQHLAAGQDVPTEVDISEDFLPEAVEDVVRRHHPLLLVLGRPGSATMPAEIVTNTAMDLLRHAPFPLLVVPTVSWDVRPPRRLLLAVDGQPFKLPETHQLLSRLLRANQGTLDVVHVATEAAPDDAPDVLAGIYPRGMLQEVEAHRVHHMQQPTVVGGVLQQAADMEADMLVVVARRHSLLGGLFHRSVTAQLIQESPVPVLVLPAEE
ncbi:universal stress protein [Hymenobacter negativus]|uniref:Universal stress protein n=1 Tax=Hymenobacter negativus TaxID=2795026 RepID=A0ABS0Q8R5_9BACT|nr:MULTISPECIES: universal stress protein [Bacteria]MBH8559069.1 universal stress protein [Hymenobacter negativus]MBH8567457.1 universal stress protein [Hymenobacter negativus]MBR7207189.1 universal stress protein [Microvirga sp. STS02]